VPVIWRVKYEDKKIMEEQIFIINGDVTLEGLIQRASGNRGVVICHPHSLMGGSMYNNVVEAVQKAFAAAEYATLRFNFRGVGRSSGDYDEGKGEQEDILAACKFLQAAGVANLFFAGYSFGAWVGSKIIAGDVNPFAVSILISPPNRYFGFEFSELTNKIKMMITGDGDQFADIGALKKYAKQINAQLKIIAGVDHFYFGREKELVNILGESLFSPKTN